MEAPIVLPDDHAPRLKLRGWSLAWQRKIEAGVIAGFRAHLPTSDTCLHMIANILKQHGIEPAPEQSRKTTWKEFLSRHWEQVVASDFFTIEVWTQSGLHRFVVLFFMELSTRRVEIAGVASRADGLWMTQIARNLTDGVDVFFKGKRHLIHDRDPLYTREFLSVLAEAGIESTTITQFERIRGTICQNDERR